MLKYRVTNISEADKFLVEAGRLLPPGASIPVNRLDAGTRNDPGFKIEKGQFDRTPIPTKMPKKPTGGWFDDDDDDKKVAAKAETGPAKLVTTTKTKGMRVVPLQSVTPDEDPEAADDDDAGPVISSGERPDDEMDIPSAVSAAAFKDDESETIITPTAPKKDSASGGFVDRKLPTRQDHESA